VFPDCERLASPRHIVQHELLFMATWTRLIEKFQPSYHLLSTMMRRSHGSRKKSKCLSCGQSTLLLFRICLDQLWIATKLPKLKAN
jgi:hypothetical protein